MHVAGSQLEQDQGPTLQERRGKQALSAKRWAETWSSGGRETWGPCETGPGGALQTDKLGAPSLGESWVRLLSQKVAVKLSGKKCLLYALAQDRIQTLPTLELVQWELLMFLFRICFYLRFTTTSEV